ncbi:thiamine phosphate synthase [Paenibacillus enshidis]|uniref:Thiamine-phosphate synthase n=1 Tax=Paenibacillus enshidis TaxID=1458439 RepID=A0ABV5B0D0_9BACL
MSSSFDRRIDPAKLRRQLAVYFIMGSINCGGKNPVIVLREAIAGGVTMFQFREKGTGALTGKAAYELARELQAVCREGGVPFIVNDDVEMAAALGADGIHVGQEDSPASSLRSRLGHNTIVGVSAHSVEEARHAIADGADYLGVGPMYPTLSKSDVRPVRGPHLIQELRSHGITVPLVGIGGITPAKASPVLSAGADGISVISAISQAEEPGRAAAAFAALYGKTT